MIKHYAMKAYGGVDVQSHLLLTSALGGSEWSASRYGRFTSGERAPCTRSIRGWVGLRTCLDDMQKKEILPYRDSNTDPSTVQPIILSVFVDFVLCIHLCMQTFHFVLFLFTI
jgi:hypothetical protein